VGKDGRRLDLSLAVGAIPSASTGDGLGNLHWLGNVFDHCE
jgi:hypothetical protein